MRRLKFFVVLLLPLAVFANGSKTFDWTPPTEYENGDPLPLSEIDNYQIACGLSSGGPYLDYEFVAPGDVSTFTATDSFPEGTYYCIARTVDIQGRVSQDSNEVNFTVSRCEATDCRPKSPILSVSP